MMFEMLLGHLCGDYLLQNEYLALNKSKNTFGGWLAAVTHCMLYTLSVCLFMWNFDLIWMVAVFFSHFFIDKFSLAEKYMHYLKGKGMRDYIIKINNNTYNSHTDDNNIGQDMLTGGFTAIVYTLTDNTMHLVLMYLAYKIIY